MRYLVRELAGEGKKQVQKSGWKASQSSELPEWACSARGVLGRRGMSKPVDAPKGLQWEYNSGVAEHLVFFCLLNIGASILIWRIPFWALLRGWLLLSLKNRTGSCAAGTGGVSCVASCSTGSLDQLHGQWGVLPICWMIWEPPVSFSEHFLLLNQSWCP